MNNKVLIFTHIDLDGSSSAIMLNRIYPDAIIQYVNYGFEEDIENRKLIATHDHIIISDISFSPSFANLLNKLVIRGKQIVLLDHHDTAINKFKEANTVYDWMILDDTRSGALLCYDYISTRTSDYLDLHELAVLTDDYDRWVHNNTKSTELQFLWNKLGRDKFFERFSTNALVEFSDDEKAMIKESNDRLSYSIEVARKNVSEINTTIDGRTFRYVSDVPSMLSLTADRLFKLGLNDVDFLVLNGGYNSLSLRSTKTVINDIAKKLGGGGHELAAGIGLPEGFVDIIPSIVNYEWKMIELMPNLGVI